MFFFFPFNTDAPIYHYPIVTAGLIAVNTLLFFGLVAGEPSDMAFELVLEFSTIQPTQWLTMNFMHADIVHLLGNMLFLWPYGLVIEGKVGWWRFLILYIGICILGGAILQITMFVLGGEGFGLGASAVIFGLLGLALAWAPKNNFSCFYLWFLFFRFGAGTWELSIMIFAGIYAAKEALFWILAGFQMGGAAGHLLGFAIGLPVGLLMVRLDWVDCEGWDLISIWQGKGRGKLASEMRLEEEAAAAALLQKKTHGVADEDAQALTLLKEHVSAGRGQVAYTVFCKHAGEDGRRWQVPEEDLIGLVNAMHKEKLFSQSVPPLVQLVSRFPDRTHGARLKLAQILVQLENRPKQAQAVLNKLPDNLPKHQEIRRRQIAGLAKKSIAEGNLEMGIEDW